MWNNIRSFIYLKPQERQQVCINKADDQRRKKKKKIKTYYETLTK